MRLSQLGTPALTWRRLDVLLRQLPTQCALHRSISNEEDYGWGLDQHLLAAVVDALNLANWQRSGDAKAPRPRQIPRPGVRQDTVEETRHGTARPLEEIRSIFERRRAAQMAAEAAADEESGLTDGS